MAQMRHIAIAGAGVVGLSCALELRRRGLTVTVLEAGAAMREASWTAGGMLAVDDPENPPALLSLSRYSRSLYESFLREVARLSGLPIPLRTHRTLQVAPCAHSAQTLAGSRLTLREAQQYAPGLAACQGGYLLLEEASLDPRDLCAALPLAARAAGVELREHEPVESVATRGHQVCITTARTTLDADALLNCSGAWSCGAWSSRTGSSGEGAVSSLPGQRPPETAAVTPRKGQMMVVAAPEAPPLACVLRSPQIYLIPRGDGRIAVGATVEDAGFSKSVDAQALELLRRRAAELWPPIADAPLLESWAGLRPATRDGLPLLGAEQSTGGDPRRWIAAGHYRNGILLAPGTAVCMAALLLDTLPPVDLSAFAPHRMRSPKAWHSHLAAAL